MKQLQKEGDTQMIFSVDDLIDAFISRQSFAQFRLSQYRKERLLSVYNLKLLQKGMCWSVE